MYSTFPVYIISRLCLNSNRIFSNLDTNKKTFDTLNLQSCLPIVAELDSLVKRKTSTNSGSNRKKFNVNTTNIHSIQIRLV